MTEDANVLRLRDYPIPQVQRQHCPRVFESPLLVLEARNQFPRSSKLFVIDPESAWGSVPAASVRSEQVFMEVNEVLVLTVAKRVVAIPGVVLAQLQASSLQRTCKAAGAAAVHAQHADDLGLVHGETGKRIVAVMVCSAPALCKRSGAGYHAAMAPPPSPQLSVSLVTYYSDLPTLQRTLDSLVVACAGLQVELVAVDNSVDEAYADALRALLQRYAGDLISSRMERSSRNDGYGAAHNRAAALCCAPSHLILNPDVELVPNSLREGLALLTRDAGLVLVAPHVVDGTGAIQYLCKRHPSVRVLCLRAFAPDWLRVQQAQRLANYEMQDACNGRDSVEIPLASGCFMLLRRAAFDAVDGFDESFFLYFEDYDLSVRLAREGRLQYEPSVRIIHHGGFAARKGWWHMRLFAVSAARFFARHGWRW